MLEALTGFLLDLCNWLIELLYNAVIELLNAIIYVLGTFIISLVSLFPGNPCGSLIASCSDATSGLTAPSSALWSAVLQAIAWLLPISYLVNLIGCAMVSIMIYFTIAPLMRWAKLST